MRVEKILVKVNGRLGNQLFQYAFARALQLKYGGDLILDFSPMGFSGNHKHEEGWENSLDYFNVAPYTYTDLDNQEEYHETKTQRFLYKALNRIKRIGPKTRYAVERFDYLFLSLFGMYYMESYNTASHVIPPLRKNLFLRGWFESAHFFQEYDEQICRELTPKNPLSTDCQALYETLSNSESICVSIRRGDFLTNKGCDVCSPQYFEKGIEYILAKCNNPVLFLCSDDVEWCKRNLHLPLVPIFHQTEQMRSWEVLHLMSSCQHFVISNSTFAWWGQHLSQRDNKIVVAPKLWRNESHNVFDIRENKWILM